MSIKKETISMVQLPPPKSRKNLFLCSVLTTYCAVVRERNKIESCEDANMSKTENVELTVFSLIEDGDRLLLQNRIKKDWHGYALPGGHVERGESFVDAVIREM